MGRPVGANAWAPRGGGVRLSPSALRALSALVDGPGLLTEAGALATYGRDWSGAFSGRPGAVVRPRDTDAVARVVGFCAREGLAIVPQGGRTGLVGGAVPLDGEIVLSLERMRAVRRVDREERAIVVEAGLTLEGADLALRASAMRLPVDLASRGTAQVGGLLATAAGGVRHVRDGRLAAHVRGLEVVLGDGRLLANLSTLEKNNTGYGWAQLFLGSEGTLGVITAASIGTVPVAPAARALWLTLPALEVLAPLVERIRARCLGLLAALEFVDRSAVEALALAGVEARPPVGAAAPMHLLVATEAGDGEACEAALIAVAAAATADGLAVDAALAQDERERRALWRVRESLPEAIGRLGRVRRYDVAVPLVALGDLMDTVKAAVHARALPVRPVFYGHVAEGNIHLNMVLGAGADARLEAELDAIVYDAVVAREGTISAEHGIGTLKRDHLHVMRSAAELRFMAELKRLCDPAGILNPGKLLPPTA